MVPFAREVAPISASWPHSSLSLSACAAFFTPCPKLPMLGCCVGLGICGVPATPPRCSLHTGYELGSQCLLPASPSVQPGRRLQGWKIRSGRRLWRWTDVPNTARTLGGQQCPQKRDCPKRERPSRECTNPVFSLCSLCQQDTCGAILGIQTGLLLGEPHKRASSCPASCPLIHSLGSRWHQCREL